MSLDQAVTEAVKTAISEEVDRILRLSELQSKLDSDRLAFTEIEAARLFGVSSAWLKDQRLSGRIKPFRRSRPILYSRDQLSEIADLLRD